MMNPKSTPCGCVRLRCEGGRRKNAEETREEEQQEPVYPQAHDPLMQATGLGNRPTAASIHSWEVAVRKPL